MMRVTAPHAAFALALLGLSTVPLWAGNSYYVDVASQILLFAVFALALNVLVGYGGLVSLGHAGLFAVSGYTAGLMLQAGFGHAAAIAGAVLATLLTSAVFAVLALRSTGIGFLMITARARPDHVGHRISLGGSHQTATTASAYRRGRRRSASACRERHRSITQPSWFS